MASLTSLIASSFSNYNPCSDKKNCTNAKRENVPTCTNFTPNYGYVPEPIYKYSQMYAGPNPNPEYTFIKCSKMCSKK